MRIYIYIILGILAVVSCKDKTPVSSIDNNEETGVPEPINPVLEQTFYFDFGSSLDGRGDITEGPDANGYYWNNITNNNGNYAAAGTQYKALVNSANTPSNYTLTLDTRFSTNGNSGGGGLLEPKEELLKDFAIATATEDYFYIESNENNCSFTISGLDTGKAYKFYAFGSRDNTQTETAYYTMSGLNVFVGKHQTSGTDLGGEGINQNIQNICESELIYPDDEGKIKFSISRYAGSYIALNILKIEEYTDIERPQQYSSITIIGDALEKSQIPMHLVSVDGSLTNVFEIYTSLKEGEFSFVGTTVSGENVNIGRGYKEGVIAKSNYGIKSSVTGTVRITIDLTSKTYEILPVKEWTLVGNVTPNGWTVDKGVPLPYLGNGVWGGTVKLTGISETSDRERFNFVMNSSWDYTMKRVKGTVDNVGMQSQGFDVEDINLNHGTYNITLDLRNYVYRIDCGEEGIDPFKISVMGSSVANGYGATDNHGYAYMFGQLLKERFRTQKSKFPWYTSGISVNGNNTLNLLARYNDLIHEYGAYVMFGLSLGNEGIHETNDKQAIFNQFKDNMLTLISKARKDGKYPVITNNYTRGDFTTEDYEYVKKMNLLIHEWDLPSVNLLGAIDNGSGKWADGYQNGTDVYHPNTDGHKEFNYAIVPSLFDALAAGKILPKRKTDTSCVLSDKIIVFVPEETVHSFTLSFRVKGVYGDVTITKFTTGNQEGIINISSDGRLSYYSPSGSSIKINDNNILDNEWHYVTLTHYYAQGRTLLYMDNVPASTEICEKLVPAAFFIGDESQTETLEYGELFFYRSGMNEMEIEALCEGRMLKSSLEIYSPLSGTLSVENLAQSLNTLSLRDD